MLGYENEGSPFFIELFNFIIVSDDRMRERVVLRAGVEPPDEVRDTSFWWEFFVDYG